MTAITAGSGTDQQVRKNKHIKSGDWRLQVLARVHAMRAEISIHPPAHASPQFVTENIIQPLDRAEYLATKDRLDIWEWFTGSQIEAAWLSLRAAREGIIRTTPDQAPLVLAKASAVINYAKGRLTDDHPLLSKLTSEQSADFPDLATVRELTAQVSALAHDVSDAQHREQRKFQNLLRLLSAVVIAVAVVLVVLVAVVPGFGVGLLPAPSALAPVSAALLALVFGAIGALLSAIPSLTTFPGSTGSPYNPIREQACLKVAFGALCGILGPILISAGFNLGVDAASTDSTHVTMAGFLMLTALCGAQQETISRFADRKANDVAPQT
jgi:hypothetical protein